MPCTPNDFLEFAKKLNEKSTSEIEYRNVISRSYYACYLLSCSYAKSNLSFSGSPNHAIIIRELSKDKKFSSLGNVLNVMKKNRKTADYNIRASISKKQAVMQVKFAEQLMSKIQRELARKVS